MRNVELHTAKCQTVGTKILKRRNSPSNQSWIFKRVYNSNIPPASDNKHFKEVLFNQHPRYWWAIFHGSQRLLEATFIINVIDIISYGKMLTTTINRKNVLVRLDNNEAWHVLFSGFFKNSEFLFNLKQSNFRSAINLLNKYGC